MEIVESFVTRNPCFKSGETIQVRGLLLYRVGCNRPEAATFINSWNRESASRASAHALIDGNSKVVYQILPWNYKAWQGRKNEVNDHYIGIKMCEPSCIKYIGGSNFVCQDTKKAMEVVSGTYQSAVELFAFLCEKFELNPLSDGVILSPQEGCARGSTFGHSDPEPLWTGLKSDFTMDGFRQDVANCLKQRKKEQSEAEEMVQKKPDDNQTVLETDTLNVRVMSTKGIEFLKNEEGCKLRATKCAGGRWTIGYGHTQGVCEGQTLPDEEAAKMLLMEDIPIYENYVNDYIDNGTISFPVNQNQFDALVSFCFNCGPGNLRTLVSRRDAQTVAEKILLYRKVAGIVNDGLIARRQRERELFLKEN